MPIITNLVHTNNVTYLEWTPPPTAEVRLFKAPVVDARLMLFDSTQYKMDDDRLTETWQLECEGTMTNYCCDATNLMEFYLLK